MKKKEKFPKLSLYQRGIHRYLQEKRIAFHMPGHAGKFLTEGIDLNILPKNIFRHDITPSYEREDLYNPKTFLYDSLQQTAKIYGTKETFYLVNGSTGGNQAALFSQLKPGDKILLSRKVHKLIYGALVATHAIPIYLESDYYQQNPLLSGLDPKQFEIMLKRHKDIKVVYLTNPNYVGICSDLKKIISLAHQFNKIIIIDEAHGAHFPFHPDFPLSGTEVEADIIIQSTHKTLNALSQTALLHVCGKRVDISRIKQVIAMFQTTSPNTILLLSIEAGIIQMANRGQELLEKTLKLARYARSSINALSPLHCYGDDLLKMPQIHDYDETKLYVDVSQLGVTGYEIKKVLGKKYRIEAEFADYTNILFSITIATHLRDIAKLLQGLKALCHEYRGKGHKLKTVTLPHLPTTFPLTPAEAFYAEHEDVPLTQSIGRISAEMITPYPPGVPILMPGELITQELVRYVRHLIKINASFSGCKYRKLAKIMVIH